MFLFPHILPLMTITVAMTYNFPIIITILTLRCLTTTTPTLSTPSVLTSLAPLIKHLLPPNPTSNNNIHNPANTHVIPTPQSNQPTLRKSNSLSKSLPIYKTTTALSYKVLLVFPLPIIHVLFLTISLMSYLMKIYLSIIEFLI